MKYLILFSLLSCATDNRECAEYEIELKHRPIRGQSRCVRWK